MENPTHPLLSGFLWIIVFTIKDYALFIAGNLSNYSLQSLDIVMPLFSRLKNLAFEKLSKESFLNLKLQTLNQSYEACLNLFQFF